MHASISWVISFHCREIKKKEREKKEIHKYIDKHVNWVASAPLCKNKEGGEYSFLFFFFFLLGLTYLYIYGLWISPQCLGSRIHPYLWPSILPHHLVPHTHPFLSPIRHFPFLETPCWQWVRINKKECRYIVVRCSSLSIWDGILSRGYYKVKSRDFIAGPT